MRWFTSHSDRRRLAGWSQLKSITLDQFCGVGVLGLLHHLHGARRLVLVFDHAQRQPGRHLAQHLARIAFEDHVAVHEEAMPPWHRMGTRNRAMLNRVL